MYVNTKVKEICADGTVEVEQDGQTKMLGKFDNIVLAVGMRGVNHLESELADSLQVVGDAVKARQVLEATEEGYESALNI